ncbi:MAG: 4-demethylwyosine synthase TYW1 [Fervidicoccaceae archaeon]
MNVESAAELEKRAEPLEMLRRILRKQHYHFVNKHTAVKTCNWTKSAITRGIFCYKCKFYGIESHRCIQMSPAVLWCWNMCVHCWRARAQDLGFEWFEVSMESYEDDAEKLADAVIDAQRRLLSGFLGNPRANRKLAEEAMRPKHVAISLAGEPTLYPKLLELVRAFHRRGMTTFLVTRGVRPDVLERLRDEEPPTQVYLSVESYTKEMYESVNKPAVPRAWELTLQSVEVLRDFGTPTVLRLTVMRGINLDEKAVEGFSWFVDKMQPTFVEVKAYMHVGASTLRLPRIAMPSHEEVKKFAESLSRRTGYGVANESRESRVVVLSMRDSFPKYGEGCR